MQALEIFFATLAVAILFKRGTFMTRQLQRLSAGLIVIASCALAACSTASLERAAVERTCRASPQQVATYTQRTVLSAGYKAMQAGQTECAVRLLEQAQAMDPQDPYAQLNLGVLHHQAGRFAQARSAYQQVIKLESTMAKPEMAVVATDGKSTKQTPGQIAKTNLQLLP